MSLSNLDMLLEHIRTTRPIFWRSIAESIEIDEEWFRAIGGPLTDWAAATVGSRFIELMTDGYVFFTMEVNRAQKEYEQRGCYAHGKYEDVFDKTYNNEEFMDKYHWGVYAANFLWHHHLCVCRYFDREFLPLLKDREGLLVDFGSGSGIWSLQAIKKLKNWQGLAVDISPTSIRISDAMMRSAKLDGRFRFQLGDAIEFKAGTLADAAVSGLLLEHLEQPHKLLDNICANLKPGAYAFVTAALTAAEVDHITEFRKESELVQMAEMVGFRVIGLYSSAPKNMALDKRFLPRSAAMILQKRRGDIW